MPCPPQHHNPSYSVVTPQGVINNPAVYQEPGYKPETPSVSTTRSSRTPPRHLPAGLCGGLGSQGRACAALAPAHDGRWAARCRGQRWGLTWPALTHSKSGSGSMLSSGHWQSCSRRGRRSCVFSVSLSSGEGGQGPIPPAWGRGAGWPPSLSQTLMGLSGPEQLAPPALPVAALAQPLLDLEAQACLFGLSGT